MTPQQPSLARLPRSRFHLAAVLLVLGLVLAGFGPNFQAKLHSGFAKLPPMLHLHALVMGTWLALFLAQVALVLKGRPDLHRRLGRMGAGLALLVLGVGIATALASASRGLQSGDGPQSLSFLATPLGDLLVFAILIAAGLQLRRRPDWHSRLMLRANLSLLAPAIARIPLPLIQNGSEWLVFGLHDACIGLVVGIDAYRQRRSGLLHPAFVCGGLLIVLAQPARIFIGASPAWLGFAGWLLGQTSSLLLVIYRHFMSNIPAINKNTRALHWIVAIAMLGLLAMGFYMTKLEVWGLYELHKSLALLACIAIALRLFWRYLRPWQALPSKSSAMAQGLAKWVHRLLLMSTLAMPISGMLFSGISGHGLAVFGLRLLTPNWDPTQPGEVLSHNESLEVLAQNLHEYFGYAVVVLLLLHVAGALKHHWVDKDATLLRMLGRTSRHY